MHATWWAAVGLSRNSIDGRFRATCLKRVGGLAGFWARRSTFILMNNVYFCLIWKLIGPGTREPLPSAPLPSAPLCCAVLRCAVLCAACTLSRLIP
jgi:hypothetical protein